MSFTLKMRFNGLCMFVRHRNVATDDRIHVLFVDARAHHHHRHEIRQRFDSQFLDGAAPGTCITKPLEEHLIEIPRSVITDTRQVTLPPALHMLTTHPAHTKVPAATINAREPVPGLGARLSLPPLGAVSVGECAEFQLAGNTVKLTNQLTWEIQGINLPNLPLKAWSTHPASPTIADLTPNRAGLIEVAFLDLPPTELQCPPVVAPDPLPGEVLPHFGMFFDLLPGAGAVPLTYVGACAAETSPGTLATGIHPRTCMLVGGEYA